MDRIKKLQAICLANKTQKKVYSENLKNGYKLEIYEEEQMGAGKWYMYIIWNGSTVKAHGEEPTLQEAKSKAQKDKDYLDLSSGAALSADEEKIKEMLSLYLKELGYSTMAADVLKASGMSELKKYANVILKDLQRNKNSHYEEILRRFKAIGLSTDSGVALAKISVEQDKETKKWFVRVGQEAIAGTDSNTAEEAKKKGIDFYKRTYGETPEVVVKFSTDGGVALSEAKKGKIVKIVDGQSGIDVSDHKTGTTWKYILDNGFHWYDSANKWKVGQSVVVENYMYGTIKVKPA